MVQEGVERYGKRFPVSDPQSIELWCYLNQPPLGLGAYGHMHNAIDSIWNAHFPDAYIWNDWSELLISTFCENEWVTVTGPAASWKTTSAGIFALAAFYADPKNTVVICTSTTLPGLRRRIWKEISRFHRMRPCFGNMVQSRDCIQFTKGQDDAGIFGVATDAGEIAKAIGKIIGFHAPNIYVIVDEMPYTPEAIVEACVNLASGAKRFKFIGLGNADDELDPHGRMCAPKAGWDSISVESERWETRRGVCIHLDGLKSPNILDKTKNYPGLLTQSDIDTTAEIYGVDSPQFWQMRRGFWAPEGVQKTVLTMPLITRGQAFETPHFDSEFSMCAGLDPAFEGGDKCSLRFGKCGAIEGKKTLVLSEKLVIKTRNTPDDPTHYQIVRQVKEACESRGVSPFYFGLDATGEGGGLAGIFQREWSRDILLVEFGGRPSRRPVSPTNPKRADQEYDRRVTELWFFLRLLVQNGQLKALDEETASQFCRRWWELKGMYISLETKLKMKDRTRQSPDDADAVVVLAELCHSRLSLNASSVSFSETRPDSPWKKFLSKRNLVPSYAAPRLY